MIINKHFRKNGRYQCSKRSRDCCRRTLDIQLINCEINLILTWSETCVIISKTTRDSDPDSNPVVVAVNNPTNATFKVEDKKLYVPVVNLSTENDNKLVE